ncbi:hypothetical protein E4631_25340 [Hymenobacter sp. UV11]|uniref:hypothetical protein n=1 Tax=Hymenobacter sp. UV11 TaxID=1849735 RepID=UPI00105CD50E|nr:hypothetical protein [Hymenobacter sp. UV11]TFZ62324.1 hypothetical protein E4631_25340 [Hymenobacter sp. UV11]
MADKTPHPALADYLQSISQEPLTASPAADSASVVAGQHLPASAIPLAPAVTSVALKAPEPAPSTSATPASPQPRPLAYFTTPAQEVTKKQSVYLPVELHRALATVVNLPGVEVSLTDLLANIVQAWRDDHRAEVRKRYREGEKSI